MATIDLIPPDPQHAPSADTQASGAPAASGGAAAHRGLLYPLWVLAVEIRPYPRAAARSLWLSVDGVRGIPLPVKGMPEVVTQEVPPDLRLLEGIGREAAIAVTKDIVKKGIGGIGSWLVRVKVTESRRVYKVFWIERVSTGETDAVGQGVREVFVDSRSGKKIEMPVGVAGQGEP